MPNGAGEKFRWGDWREPLRLSTRKGWVQGRPLIRPGFAGPPSPRGEGFGGDEPDLETFFHKHAFQHIFPRKCVPNRSWHTGGNSPTIVPKTTIPKTSERERAGHKPGVQGLPLVFFSRLSKKVGLPHGRRREPTLQGPPATVPTGTASDDRGPPPGRRQRGAAPRGLGKAPPTRRVRSTASPPGPRPYLRGPTPSGTNRNIYYSN